MFDWICICLLLIISLGCATPGVVVTPSPEANIQVSAVVSPVSADVPVCSIPYFDPISFFPDGNRLLAKDTHKIFIINKNTWKQDGVFEIPLPINSVIALSPDGSLLALSSEDNSIKLLQVASGQIINTWKRHDDIISELEFTPQGDKLISASHDTWVKIWDTQGNLLDAFQPTGADNLPSDILGMGISPDGKALATIPFDGPVKIWDLTAYKQITEMGGSGGWDTSEVAFSSDGKYLAATQAAGLWIWRISDGSLLARDINTLVFEFSPDGRDLAYSDNNHNGDVVLLDLDSMQIKHIFPGNFGWPTFSPDGSLLMSTNLTETRIWQLDNNTLLYTACDPVS